eukprot:3420034-Rhodomonas_salina.5
MSHSKCPTVHCLGTALRTAMIPLYAFSVPQARRPLGGRTSSRRELRWRVIVPSTKISSSSWCKFTLPQYRTGCSSRIGR